MNPLFPWNNCNLEETNMFIIVGPSINAFDSHTNGIDGSGPYIII